MTGDGGTARPRLVPARWLPIRPGRLLANLPPRGVRARGGDRPRDQQLGNDRRRRPGPADPACGAPSALAARDRVDGALAAPRRAEGVCRCLQPAGLDAGLGRWVRSAAAVAGLQAGKHDLLRLHGVWFRAKHGRLPAQYDGRRVHLERLLSYPRLALAARLHDGAWWEMDTWHPRCDPRIPLRDREPCRSVGCSPGEAQLPWVKNAVKWHLGMLLESGTLNLVHPDRPAKPRPCSASRAGWSPCPTTRPAPMATCSEAGTFAAAFRRCAVSPRTGPRPGARPPRSQPGRSTWTCGRSPGSWADRPATVRRLPRSSARRPGTG